MAENVCVDYSLLITARVRSTREGNVLTSVCPSIHPSVCPQGGGYPYPIMLCNISQNAMGRGGTRPGNPPGGVPDRVPPWGGPDTPPGGYLTGYPPGGSGYPPGGVPDRVPPGGVRVPPGGGT